METDIFYQCFEQYKWSIISAFFLLIIIYRFNRSHGSVLNLPPSPPRIPIIGNLHQLGSLPHRGLQALAQKHGPIMLLHLGQKPTLVISSSEAAKEVLKTQDLCFSNRAQVSFATRLLYDKDMTFAPYGEYWRQVRRICVLQLLSAQRVESFRSVREEECSNMIAEISLHSPSPPVVNISDVLMSYTNDVTCRIALGRTFHGDEISRKKFWKMMAEFMYLLGVFNVEDLIPSLAWVNRFNGLNDMVENNSKDLDDFLGGVIEEHIQAKKAANSASKGVEDFVDVLLGIENDNSLGVPFDKDSIKAVLLDMFSAGTDILSVTLIWVMANLMRHPETMKDVQKEIREIGEGKSSITEDDLGKMQYLKLVLKETLRLHPPAPLLVPRESIHVTKIQGYDIPAKTRVIVNAWAIGRDPILWEEPEEFRPKRFLDKSVDYKGADFEMIPFGGGRRGCPGLHFAVPTMELPLANLLHHFDWSLPDNATPKIGVDMGEKFGILVLKETPLLLVANPHNCK